MIGSKLTHNCPNCGAPLTSDGYCNYCKTKIRYANMIEFDSDFGFNGSVCEILFKTKSKDGDETILFPFRGIVNTLSMEMSIDSYPKITMEMHGLPIYDDIDITKLKEVKF